MRHTVILMALVSAGPLAAQSDLTRLHGVWQGQGTFQGGQATGSMTWEAALAQRFTRLTLALKVGERTVFEGQAFYPASPLGGTWFDSQGSVFRLSVSWSGDSLVSLWGPEPGRPLGRSVYRLDGSDHLTVSDFVAGEGGQWREFGRMAYRRSTP